MIRFFAAMDDTIYGRIALAYCNAIAKLDVTVRLISTGVANIQLDDENRETSKWGRHRELMMTRIESPFITLVCCEPEGWDKFYTPMFAPARRGVGGAAPVEMRATGCVRNVLVCTSLHGPKEVARKYEVILHTQSMAAREEITRRNGERARAKARAANELLHAPQSGLAAGVRAVDAVTYRALEAEAELARYVVDDSLEDALRMPS